jgi:glycosyltransferase involved in cell wall biosynthesis
MPTRVLLLGAHPARGHGLRRLSRLTAAAWHEAGAEVSLATAPDPLSRRVPWGAAGDGLAAAESAAWLTALLRRTGSDIDLVHVLDPRDVVYTASIRDRIPVTVTCHDLSAVADDEESGRRVHPVRRARARAVQRALVKADQLVPTSHFAAAELQRLIGVTGEVVHLPVDPALAERPARIDAWKPPAWPYLLIVGGPEPHTRRATSIQAWTNLRRTPALDGASLVVVGPGLDAQEEALVTACGGHVSVLSDVSDAQLGALYGRSRAVLALNRPRGFTWPVIEAHQAGRPVLATDHEVFQEVGGAGCVYLPVEGVPRFDAATWVSIAEDLTASLVRDRACVNAERFAWHRFVERLPEVAFPEGSRPAAPDQTPDQSPESTQLVPLPARVPARVGPAAATPVPPPMPVPVPMPR